MNQIADTNLAIFIWHTTLIHHVAILLYVFRLNRFNRLMYNKRIREVAVSTFTLFGSWWGGNLGDVAILCGAIEAIQKEFENPSFIIPSSNPENLQSHLPDYSSLNIVQVWNNYWGKKTIGCIRDADTVIIGGGGLIFSNNLHNPIKNHLVNIAPLVYLTKLLNTETHLLGVGVSTLEGKISTHLTKRIVYMVEQVAVRDFRSKQILEKFCESDIQLIPDMAFALTQSSSKNVSKYINRLPEKFAIVSLHHHLTLNSMKKPEPVAREIINSVDQLISKQESSIVFHNNYVRNSWLRNLISNMNLKSEYRFLDLAKATPHQIINVFAEANRAVCSQMHANIMAIIGGTPTTAIEYDPKVRSMMDFVNQEARVLTIEQALNGTKLAEAFSTYDTVPTKYKIQLKKEILDKVSSQLK